jgi:hypothetical protein
MPKDMRHSARPAESAGAISFLGAALHQIFSLAATRAAGGTYLPATPPAPRQGQRREGRPAGLQARL